MSDEQTYDVNFTCPECGGHHLEEVMTEMTQSSEVTGFTVWGSNADEVDFDYGNVSTKGGEIYYCGCKDCGYQITDDEVEAEPLMGTDLVDWLRDHEMLE